MNVPSGKATAPLSRQKGLMILSVSESALRHLIHDYQYRRAQLEQQQTDQHASSLFRRTLQLQARTLTMVINDLEALAAGKPGRLGRG